MSDPANPQSTSVLPWWVRVLDVATVAACLLLVSNVVFEGFRFRAGTLRFTATSPWRTLIIALVLAGVRHALLRSPALHQRLIGRVRLAWRSDTRRIVLPAFVASRTMLRHTQMHRARRRNAPATAATIHSARRRLSFGSRGAPERV